ncbi:MAG: Gfo/Idh/MocA family oxidoreductase [Acidobacteria bacterium]|nr:Gfo/Idh/MocA family oxidoreductase [Acidobacteriota bacterium]
MHRRDFVRSAATAAALTAASYDRVLGANERVSLGFVGLGNRGDQVLDAFLEHGDSEINALCDIRPDYVDYHSERTSTRGKRTRYQDYRKLLDQKDLDAVVICTPDHWHALMTIHACQAGKDVYVEKPLSLTVVEGRRMVQAVNRYNRVSQVGTHRRSLNWCKQYTEIARTGGIGHVSVADSFYIANDWPNGIGAPANSAPPPGVDWDAWLGPAPEQPYNPNKTFYNFRWFFPFSGGQVTNFGVHYLDMIHWALGQNAPLRVAAFGGVYAVEDNRQVPDTCKVIWEYPGGVIVGFNQYNANGSQPKRKHEIELRGTKGTIYARGRGFTLEPEVVHEVSRYPRTPLDRETERTLRSKTETFVEPMEVEGSSDTAFHTRNFLDCVKSRAKCNADIETGHRSTSTTLLANIALRTGLALEWDAVREQFTNQPQANELLHYEYRKGYELPSV